VGSQADFSTQTLAGILQGLRCVTPDATLKVAYSGGLDSTVLLHALSRLQPTQGWKLEAVHVHHGLHPQASEWAERCRAFSRELSVPFRVEYVDVGDTAVSGPEAAARLARYRCLSNRVGPMDVLLTAHHLNDQAETLLQQLMRGAGVAGLSAMPLETPFAGGWHARPLLGFPRALLLGYAMDGGLSWIDDSSNLDTRLGRNFIRHRVLPLLGTRWPAASAMLARTARHASEAARLLAVDAAHDLKRCQRDDGSIDLTVLGQRPAARQRNILREWIRRRKFPVPSMKTLDDLLFRVRHVPKTGQARFPVGAYEVGRYLNYLYLLGRPVESAGNEMPWNPPWPADLPDGGVLKVIETRGSGLAKSRIVGLRLTIDWRHGGERCRLSGQAHHQALKKILQEAGIPPWERARMPLVRVEGQIAAIGDRWICEPFAARAHEPALLLRIDPSGD